MFLIEQENNELKKRFFLEKYALQVQVIIRSPEIFEQSQLISYKVSNLSTMTPWILFKK